jgi:hypothetical protein
MLPHSFRAARFLRRRANGEIIGGSGFRLMSRDGRSCIACIDGRMRRNDGHS